MWLVLQIALGMLLGYILIENRKQIFEAASGLAILAIFAAVAAIALFVITYVGGSTADAFSDYGSADWVGKKVFFGIGMIVFLILAASMLFGIWLAFVSLIPMRFIEFCERKGKPNWPGALSVLLTIGLLIASSNIVLPGVVGSWETAWTEWGLAHGMGYDGGTTFDLLLWQLIWVPNFFWLRLRGRTRFLAAIEKAKAD